MVKAKSESRAKINKAWAEEARRIQGIEDDLIDVKDVPEGIELFGVYLTGRCSECGCSGFKNSVVDSKLLRACKACSDVKRVG